MVGSSPDVRVVNREFKSMKALYFVNNFITTALKTAQENIAKNSACSRKKKCDVSDNQFWALEVDGCGHLV